MKKLYKRGPDGTLQYHEAWCSGDSVIEHYGQVGQRGSTSTHRINKKNSDDKNIDTVLKRAVETGFRQFDDDKLFSLVVEYSIVGFGTVNDLQKRHELEDHLNETLGWTGLGHCDGGSTGSNTMEVFCIVVDFEVARSVIENDLKNSKFFDYSRIFDQTAS